MTTEELALEVERLRGVLARIESLVWYEPQDDDDTVESVRAMVRERDEARAEAQAWQAEELARRTERDAARAEVDRLRRDLARCREAQRATAEGWRHEVAEVASIIGAPAHTAELAACVRAEVERMRAETSSVLDANNRALDGLQTMVEFATSDLKRMEAERDALLVRVDCLRDALRKLLLSRDAAWTGGHDWQEAVDGAIRALGAEVDE